MGESGDVGNLGAATGPDVNPADDHSIVIDNSDKCGIGTDQDGNAVLALPHRPARPDEYGSDDGPAASDNPAGSA